MSHAIAQPAQDLERPLCVDLDGTLTKVDTLYDTFLLLMRKNPRALLKLPGWLAGDKANLSAPSPPSSTPKTSPRETSD